MPNGQPGGQSDFGDLIGPESVREQLNVIEQLQGSLGASDEYLEAILENQRAVLMMTLAQSPAGSIPPDQDERSPIERRSLPIDALGIANRVIHENDTGPATFQLQGTVFNAEVRATEDLAAGDAIIVTGSGNEVELAANQANPRSIFPGDVQDAFVYEGKFRRPPQVVRPEDTVMVENQLYDLGQYTTVSGDLNAGETKEFARIEVQNDEFILLKYTYASALSTAEYNYYVDGDQNPDPDLSGSTPISTPPDRGEVNPDGWMLVENSVSLEIEETSGSNSYSNVTALLSGLVQEV